MKKLMFAMLAAAVAAGSALAQVAGVATTTDNRQLKGTFKWRERDKSYVFVQEGKNVEVALPGSQIKSIIVPQPPALAAAINQIKNGNPQAAIPDLEKVAAGYVRLNWDEVATRYLAEAYLKADNVDKTLEVCEKVIKSNPAAAYSGDCAPFYWKALLKKGRNSTVEELAEKAIQETDRTTSAFAHLVRGDVILAGGDTPALARKALRDGYLRVVLLYQNVAEAQPEALYKAAQCFEKMSQSGRADKMRTKLKDSYPDSEWAKK